jgi:hypothetical protein
MPRMVGPILLATLLAALGASPARAATRYAAPDGSPQSPACAAADPCTIDRAVNGSALGDEVVVGPGTYALSVPLKPGAAIDLHGDADHTWPRVIGGAKLSGSVLTLRGGTIVHLSLEATAHDQRALTLQSGIADGTRLWSADGPAAALSASMAGTSLRNSVVQGTKAGLTASGKGDVRLRNVTVMATGASAEGIECDVDGSATLVNVLVRGGDTDIDAHRDTCTAAFSNFRPDRSSGLGAGAGNQSAEPLFADAEYRPAAGSPTVDAGALDAFATSPDPDGRPRALGAAPDIGAYEFAPAASGGAVDGKDADPATGDMPEDLRGVPLPKQGVSVVVAPARGRIRVRRPGSATFERLGDAARVPVGSVVDARRGRVRLVSAIGAGAAVQSGLFWGSKFRTTQRRAGNGMTTLRLRGGNLAACTDRVLAAAAKKRKRPRRGLWARDRHGRFRTHGNDSVATARGTAWYTEDRCGGTLTRVTAGAVSVRDLRRHRRVLVRAGHSYLARRGARR